jgi:hypothetical protein
MRSAFVFGPIGAFALLALVLLQPHAPGTVHATTPACADLNGDGVVTLADLLIWVTYFGQTVPPAPPQADLSENGAVDFADVFILIKHFGTATGCQGNPIGPKGTPKPTPTPAPTPPPEPEMSLNVTSAGAYCNDPEKPTKCTVPPSSQFTLAVEVNHAPVKGYVGFQTQIVYGSLTYKPTDDFGEAEVTWPPGAAPFGGFLEVRIGIAPGVGEGVVHHLAASTSGLPPYPVSAHVGNIVEVALNCPPSGSFKIALPVLSLANPWGSHFVKPNLVNALPRTVVQQLVDVDGDATPELVDVADTLLIKCDEPPVGGIAELPEVAGTPLEATGSSGVSTGVLAGLAAAMAIALGLGGAAWYARRR